MIDATIINTQLYKCWELPQLSSPFQINHQETLLFRPLARVLFSTNRFIMMELEILFEQETVPL